MSDSQDREFEKLRTKFRSAMAEFDQRSQEGRLVSAVGRTFDRMKIAEQVIGHALAHLLADVHQSQHKHVSETDPTYLRVWGVFGALCPPDCMRDKGDRCYGAHCQELVVRARNNEDLRPGTDAECLCALLDFSLKCPPNGTASAACERLFFKVFAPVRDEFALQWAHERYTGAADELIAQLRAKCGDDTRRLSVKVPVETVQ